MMSDLTVPSMTPQGAVGVCAVVSRLTETFSPHNKTNTKRPALSSLMRTCCIIYTVHVSWTHFSRTLYYSYFRADTVVTQKRTGCDFGFTPSTLMSLCLSLTLSPLWLTFICYWARWCVKDDRWSYNGVQMWEVMTRCMDTHCSLNPQPAFSDFPAASAGPAAAGSLLQAFYHSAMMCPKINPYLIW